VLMAVLELPFINLREEIRYGIRAFLDMIVSQLAPCATCHLLEVRKEIKVQTTICAPFSSNNDL